MTTKTTNLLTLANAKTVKGEAEGFLTGVLYMAPHSIADGSTNLCAAAFAAGCDTPCLMTAGRAGMAPGNATFTAANGSTLPDNRIIRARIRKALQFINDREAFMVALVKNVQAVIRKATRTNLTPCIRLNGTTDIPWETIPVTVDGVSYPNIFAAFPAVQFYDYTKIPTRIRALAIPNYHLTFSYSPKPSFAPYIVKALKSYGDRMNFAVVFRGPMPKYFLGRPVVSGDETDLRFLDAPGVVVGLTAKGRAKRGVSDLVVYTA